MIEVFKILTGKYDTAATPVLDIYDLKTTRGNDFKLNKIRAKYDLRKYFFTNRVVNIWNSSVYRNTTPATPVQNMACQSFA